MKSSFTQQEKIFNELNKRQEETFVAINQRMDQLIQENYELTMRVLLLERQSEKKKR